MDNDQLAALIGSPAQISWASKIRYNSMRTFPVSEYQAQFAQVTDATWFISNRDGSGRVLRQDFKPPTPAQCSPKFATRASSDATPPPDVVPVLPPSRKVRMETQPEVLAAQAALSDDAEILTAPSPSSGKMDVEVFAKLVSSSEELSELTVLALFCKLYKANKYSDLAAKCRAVVDVKLRLAKSDKHCSHAPAAINGIEQILNSD